METKKFIKIGVDGNIIPVEDCYAYTYDSGDGKTVLRIKIKDTEIDVSDVISLFNNIANNVIYEYKLEDTPAMDPDMNPAQGSTDSTPNYVLVSEHINFCKEMSYEYGSHTFSVEITKKLAEEQLNDENREANTEIMLAIADMYSI